jgi:hypothetical protein
MDVVCKVWRVISRSDSRVAVAWIRNRRAISSDRSNLPGSDRGAVHFSAAGSQWSPHLSALPFFWLSPVLAREQMPPPDLLL